MTQTIKRSITFALSAFLLAGCSACGTPDDSPAYDLGGKTYWNTEERYGNETHSSLWFGKDGSFVITDNFYDGYYEISGSWELNENVVTLAVESTGVGSFTKILFEVQDENTLELKTLLAGSYSGDIFSTEKTTGSGDSTIISTGPGPIPSPSPSPDISPGLGIPGTEAVYVHEFIPDMNEAFYPKIAFHEDATFEFTENCFSGMGYYKGWYDINSSGYICHVTETKAPGSDSVKTIEFSYANSGELCLETDLVLSMKGDVFIIEE